VGKRGEKGTSSCVRGGKGSLRKPEDGKIDSRAPCHERGKKAGSSSSAPVLSSGARLPDGHGKMTFGSFLFTAWLTFSVLPFGSVNIYDPLGLPTKIPLDLSTYTELGGTVRWGPAFLTTSVRSDSWVMGDPKGFYVNEIEWVTGIGLKWDDLEVGMRAVCYHPMIPYEQKLVWIGVKVVPKWEGSYQEIYLTIGRR